jgi:hypothetical protein
MPSTSPLKCVRWRRRSKLLDGYRALSVVMFSFAKHCNKESMVANVSELELR